MDSNLAIDMFSKDLEAISTQETFNKLFLSQRPLIAANDNNFDKLDNFLKRRGFNLFICGRRVSHFSMGNEDLKTFYPILYNYSFFQKVFSESITGRQLPISFYSDDGVSIFSERSKLLFVFPDFLEDENLRKVYRLFIISYALLFSSAFERLRQKLIDERINDIDHYRRGVMKECIGKVIEKALAFLSFSIRNLYPKSKNDVPILFGAIQLKRSGRSEDEVLGDDIKRMEPLVASILNQYLRDHNVDYLGMLKSYIETNKLEDVSLIDVGKVPTNISLGTGKVSNIDLANESDFEYGEFANLFFEGLTSYDKRVNFFDNILSISDSFAEGVDYGECKFVIFYPSVSQDLESKKLYFMLAMAFLIYRVLIRGSYHEVAYTDNIREKGFDFFRESVTLIFSRIYKIEGDHQLDYFRKKLNSDLFQSSKQNICFSHQGYINFRENLLLELSRGNFMTRTDGSDLININPSKNIEGLEAVDDCKFIRFGRVSNLTYNLQPVKSPILDISDKPNEHSFKLFFSSLVFIRRFSLAYNDGRDSQSNSFDNSLIISFVLFDKRINGIYFLIGFIYLFLIKNDINKNIANLVVINNSIGSNDQIRSRRYLLAFAFRIAGDILKEEPTKLKEMLGGGKGPRLDFSILR